MTTGQSARLESLTLSADRLWKSDRRFYSVMAAAAAAVVFAGFARTYYLKSYTDARELSPLLHVHGATFSAWVVLFIVQVRLVAGRRLKLHQRLGLTMAALSAGMVILGVMTVIAGARSGTTVPGFTPNAFMLVPLTDILVFGIAVSLAVIYRRRSAVHKRWMLLALTGGLLLPAISRLPGIQSVPATIPLVLILFLGAGAVYDRFSRGHIHPVNKWGALAVLLTVPLRLLLSGTSAWDAVASWLIQ